MEDVYEFNAQFTKYINKELPAHDIITILNLIIEWNENNEYDKIKVEKLKLLDKTVNNVHNYTKEQLNSMFSGNINAFILQNYADESHAFKLEIKGYDDLGKINKISIKQER